MAAIMTGDADLRLRTEERPRLLNIAVLLPEMHAIGAEALRKAHAVVDDERDAGVRADALERLGQPSDLMLGDVLHPQLERRNDIVLHGGSQPIRERPAHRLGRDEI